MKKNSTQAVDTRRHGLLDANLATAEHTKFNVMDPSQEERNITRKYPASKTQYTTVPQSNNKLVGRGRSHFHSFCELMPT
jgi:hypothetical protein